MKRGIYILTYLTLFLISFILFESMIFALGFYDSNNNFTGTFNYTFYNISGFIQVNQSNFTFFTNVTELIGNETGLISYFRFNESSWNGTNGEVKDVLGNSNGTAKNISTANISSGLFGNSANFSGAAGTYTNEVQIINKETLNPRTGSFTITGWAKSIARGGNGYQLYVAKRDNAVGGKNGYYIGILEGSGIKFAVGDGTNRVDTAYVNINYTKWFHFAAVINRTSNQSLIYINGSLGASASISNVNNINNSWNLSIGNDEGQALLGATYQYPVNGQIDELGFWNRALSSSEILALYQKGIANQTSSSDNVTNGTYESDVKDAGTVVNWTNISWNGLTEYRMITSDAPNLLMYLDGNANDENNINNGTAYGAVNVSGKINQGYYFDGDDDYISIADSNSLDFNSNFTVGAWVNFSSLPSVGEWQGIITKGGQGDNSGSDHNFFISFDNNMGWGVGVGITFGFENSAGINNQTRYQFTPELNQWYLIVGVFNDSANTITLYINGSEVAQNTGATGTPSTNSNPVYIGRNMEGSTSVYYLNGVVDEAFISNTSLTPSKIQQIYDGSSVSNLRFKLRTSNDNISWSSYTGSDGTSGTYYSSPGALNLTNSRYLQYKAYLDNIVAKLYNITINYNTLSEGVSVSLDTPDNNYLTNEYNINITCSVSSSSGLANITPYYSKFGWGASEVAREISGTSNTTTFILSEITSTIDWNCYACNVNGSCGFASSNKTIIGDILFPTINLISPIEGHNENSTQTIDFIFNAADERATTLDCKLIVDNNEVASNSSVVSGINTTFSYYLSNGNYSWKINCSDGVNSVLTEERNITMNILTAYTPFFAKANTHTHTSAPLGSDGSSNISIVLNTYRNLNYSIIAITDHSKINNCSAYTNLSSNFLCVNSEEWTSTKHIVRINISSAVAGNSQNAVDSANNDGGFAIAAHPNWSSTLWTVNELVSLQNYTAMEIYNKVIERLSPDPYAVQKWDDVLKTGKKIFGVAADDMHIISSDLGFGFTKVYMPEFTKAAYINSMKTGYFYSSQGPSMDSGQFSLACDESTIYHMGETANCSAIRVNATISATNSSFTMKNITLIKDGNIINFITCSLQNCSFSYSENVSSSGYYRLEGIDTNNKRVWSNPIWVNKIALPVVITVNSPENNSLIYDYTPLFNISLNQQTSLWHNTNNGTNISLCNNCSSYSGYITLKEGSNIILVYANNSDNIVKENKVYVSLDFNKSVYENFSDNSSIFSTDNVFWNNGKMSLGAGNMFGNFVIKAISPINNITSFHVEWQENNTDSARGEGQRIPIIIKYKFRDSSWIYTNSSDGYIINGSSISGLNGNDLSIMFDYEKNNETPIDILNFSITWTEFTIPLITNVSVSSVTSNSAVISWNTDLDSNSSVLYGVSSSLGSVISLNNSVKSHSITLIGLNPSTGYFYKIMSCTDSSCSEDPQVPYTPYSFTTQSSTVTSPTGGGGSGSSGGISYAPSAKPINKTLTPGLEISKLSDIVSQEGSKKILSINVKNIGGVFLNKCRLILNGSINSWFYSNQIQGIAPGESVSFVFDINIPENVFGEHLGELNVNCDEIKKSQNIKVIVPRGLSTIIIKELKYQKKGLDISYSLDTTNFYDDSAEIEIWLIDGDGIEEKRIKDSFNVNKGGISERNILMELPEGLTGIYTIYFAYSNDLENYVKQSVVLGKSSATGLAILDEPRNKMIIYVIFVFALFIIVFFIMWGKSKNKGIKGVVLKKRIK